MPQNINPALKSNSNKTPRNSNLELFRIIAMLLIIAHHYVVNSGLSTEIASNPKSIYSICLCLFGMWGKIGINCYLLITGYFMCKSQITLQKFIKLWFGVVFYGLIFYTVFIISAHHEFTLRGLLYALIPINDVTNYFVSCLLAFYLFIPYLNILIQGMDKRKHQYLIVLSS
jgi:peptidoglycan/LPS O-acetylase OafA/YrhL